MTTKSKMKAQRKVTAADIQDWERLKAVAAGILYEELLSDAVAVAAHGPAAFWAKPQWKTLFWEDRQSLNDVVDQLRALWSMDTPAKEKTAILRDWSPFAAVMLMPVPDKELWAPPLVNLRGALMLAVMRHSNRLRICANPECGRPFVAGKTHQKYCDRPECKVAAQSTYMHRYYEKTLKQRRQKRGVTA